MGNQSMRNKLLDAIDKQRYDRIADLLDVFIIIILIP